MNMSLRATGRSSSRNPGERAKPLALPWRERSGVLSWLKLAMFIGLFAPWAVATWTFQFGPPVARPITEIIHITGDWAVYFLLASLAVTPARHIFQWGRALILRRMIGVAAFAWVAVHVTFYIIDQRFDWAKVASEIVLRVYLTIGFAGLVILGVLAATSTDAMVRRIGGQRWQRLHKLAYLAMAIGVVHYFLQSKADVTQATLMGAFALWLFSWRIMTWRLGARRASGWRLLGALTLGIALLVALLETAYFSMKFHAPFTAVMEAQWMLDGMGPRPALILLCCGAGLLLAQQLRLRLLAPQPSARQRA